MMATQDPTKELVLPPGRYVYIQNDKGQIDLWCGPVRVTSSSSNEIPLAWDGIKKLFVPSVEDPRLAVRNMIQVAKDEYVVLEGLPILKQGDLEHPAVGQTRSVDIDVAERTTIHGPQVFALWPRQNASVIPGHRLTYSQYLLVRVYDDRQAKKTPDPALITSGVKIDDVEMGDLFVIKGTATSLYMPGPGIEVVKDEDNSYVRDAVTVEPLEYAYLRDLNGEKEYVKGPDVVFPRPTQTFVTRTLSDGTIVNKSRALELTETSALYVKVTQPYEEEAGPDAGTKREIGEELFLRGKDYPLYYPRKEHMLIRQGDSEIHFAIAIPRGSGYYVRNKRMWQDETGQPHTDGEVELVKGPKTLLIDPRNQTLVTRALPLDKIALMYPGNQEAATINQQRLRANAERAGIGVMPTAALEAAAAPQVMGVVRRSAVASRQFEGEVSNRPQTYAKPHTIDLGSSKYDGAPRMAIDPGYAVLLINSIGNRRVVQNGEVALLEYDEYPRVLRFSTGTPKSGHERRSDVYLRTVTKVSDQISLETSDGVRLTLQLSYRVRFEGDPKRWFDIEDPVGFMTDNMRSIIHHEVAKAGIREFYKNYTAIVRTVVLGGTTGDRPGRVFDENGMRIYDVDVLELSFEDDAIAALFEEAAKAAFKDELHVTREQRQFELLRSTTEITVARSALTADSATRTAENAKKQVQAEAEAAIARILAQATQADETAKVRLAAINAVNAETEVELANNKLRTDATHAVLVAGNDEKVRLLEAEVTANVTRLAAIQPGLIEALTRLGDAELIDKVAKHFNVQTLLGGTSISGALNQALAGTRLAGLLEQATGQGTNGQAKASVAHA